MCSPSESRHWHRHGHRPPPPARAVSQLVSSILASPLCQAWWLKAGASRPTSSGWPISSPPRASGLPSFAIGRGPATIAYPILPRHLTIIDALVIGIPGFFWPSLPTLGAHPGFIFRVARFVIPIRDPGRLPSCSLPYLGCSADWGPPSSRRQTMETIIFCFIGWRVIAAVEAPYGGGG